MVHALARHPGHVKDRDSLMRDARIVVDDATITSHVKRIRKKFGASIRRSIASTPCTGWAIGGTNERGGRAPASRDAKGASASD